MFSWFRRKKPDAARERRLDTTGCAHLPNSRLSPPVDPRLRSLLGSDRRQPCDAADLPEQSSTPAARRAGKPGWRERLRGSGFARSLGGLFSRNPKLDDDLLDEIETALLSADVGVTATTQLVEGLRKRMKAREFADANALLRRCAPSCSRCWRRWRSRW